MVAAGQAKHCHYLPIDKWACPTIEIVEMQQVTLAGAGIATIKCRPRLV